MKVRHFAFITAAALNCAALWAGDSDHSSSPIQQSRPIDTEWKVRAAIYGPLMGIQGVVGAQGFQTPIEVPFDEIIGELDGGLTTSLEARHGNWSITSDLIWLSLSGSRVPNAVTRIGFEQEQFMGSLSLGYNLSNRDSTVFDLIAGTAFTSLSLDLDVTSPFGSRSLSGAEFWVDPYVGVRFRHRMTERWAFLATCTYGGFGLSSDSYAQAFAGLSYQLTDHLSLAAVYRYLSVDYRSGSFIYDVDTTGPNIGFVYRF